MHRVEDPVVVLDCQGDLGGRLTVSRCAFPSMGAGWTVGEVLSHSCGVTPISAGVTNHPRSPGGNLLGGAHRSARAAPPRSSGTTTEMTGTWVLPSGIFTTDEAAGITLSERLVRFLGRDERARVD